MTTRAEYLKALSEAPATPLTADTTIPGLPAGEWCIPHLWALDAAWRERLGPDGVAEHNQLVAEFRADFIAGNDGPWKD